MERKMKSKHTHKRRTRPTRARITKVVSNAHAVISHNVHVSERHVHVTCIEHALLSDGDLSAVKNVPGTFARRRRVRVGAEAFTYVRKPFYQA